MIEPNTFTLLTGPAKFGKSFAILDLAVALAGACDWFGFGITKKARVLLVDLETDPHYLYKRLDRLKHGHSLTTLDGRLGILPWRHATIEPGFSTVGACERIAAEAEKHQADVVLIDGLNLMIGTTHVETSILLQLLKNKALVVSMDDELTHDYDVLLRHVDMHIEMIAASLTEALLRFHTKGHNQLPETRVKLVQHTLTP